MTGLTLLVIAAAGRWAPRESAGERVLIRALLGALAALTLVIVACALYRMQVYQQAYGYTRLRVFVFAVEIALGVVFLLVIAAGVRLQAGWLPRSVVAVGVLALLGLAVLNPDRFVADRNIDRYQATDRIDLQLPQQTCPPTRCRRWTGSPATTGPARCGPSRSTWRTRRTAGATSTSRGSRPATCSPPDRPDALASSSSD